MSTTTASPRDVVVIIETSSSMRGDILFEARHAVLTVMETLDVEDRVSLFILSTFEKAIISRYFRNVVLKRSFLNLVLMNIFSVFFALRSLPQIRCDEWNRKAGWSKY